MKRFIRIQSSKNIAVTAGLQSIDMSNKDAHVADRLNIAQVWTGTRVLVKKDVGYYPAVMSTWPAVKKLAELGVLSFGEQTDTCPSEYLGYAEELEKKLELAEANYKRRVEQTLRDPQATEKAKLRTGKSLIKPVEKVEAVKEESAE